MNNRLINTKVAGGGGGCTDIVDNYDPFDGGGLALYQLNGNANDVSTNYNGNFVSPAYTTGVFGQAASLSGTNYIDIPTLPDYRSGFAFSSWVLSDTTQNKFIIIQKGTGEYANFGYRLISGKISLITGNGTSAYYINYTHPTALTDGWHHIVVTGTASSITIYVDGAFLTTQTGTAFLNSSNMQHIMGVNYYSGSIDTVGAGAYSSDQFRFFSRALRPYEVEALYTEEYCTPTIVPSEHFNTITWDGEVGNGSRDFSGVGFQPDLVWVKRTSSGDDHHIYDSVRGAGSTKVLASNKTTEEPANNAATYGYLDAFLPDGFSSVSGSANNAFFNENAQSMVAWNFKAGGEAVTNPQGNTASQISANPDAGFSIVTHTSSMQSSQTFGHGLNSTPKIVISKVRNIADSWWVFMPDAIGSTNVLELNATAAARSVGLTFNANDTTFNIQWTTQSYDFLHYCFAEVEGFSSFGSYVGTGASGNSIVTGFEPAFVMVKRTDGTGVWVMLDNKRNLTNPKNSSLYANTSAQEDTGSTSGFYPMNFYENGFEPIQNTGDYNASGASYIYMAFAADPTTVEPSLEDSFNTVLWTGENQNVNRSITGVGFQPDFVWAKVRTYGGWNHQLYDSVRGAGSEKALNSNVTGAEGSGNEDQYGYLSSFDVDGFTGSVGTSTNEYFNTSLGYDMVAWAWKGAEIPAINSNGSIKSVVSANPAAGFSIVSYTGIVADATVGHGLLDTPSVVIVKNRQDSRDWVVWHKDLAASSYLILNSTSAQITDTRTSGGQPRPFGPFTSTTFGVNIDNETGYTNNYIAYCFAEVAGFSKFGSYNGNAPLGGTGSPIPIDCGFEPAFVMIKWTSGSYGSGGWAIWDNKRDTTNPKTEFLQANSSGAELDFAAYSIDFDPLGFTVGATGNDLTNLSGNSYIYMAFANQF